MGCTNCDDAQKGRHYLDTGLYFVRVGPANVEIVGCLEHVEATVDKLRTADQVDELKRQLVEATQCKQCHGTGMVPRDPAAVRAGEDPRVNCPICQGARWVRTQGNSTTASG